MTEDQIASVLADDPRGDALRAGLRYVDQRGRGYRRQSCGRGFTYRDATGSVVRSQRLRARFAKLAIPPAWRDVWICPDFRGHLQVTGIDEAERRQYIYHPAWRDVRDGVKFRRMLAFGRLLPRVRSVVRRDLLREGMPRRRVLAAIVRLLESSFARIGHDEYAEQNETYGLATLRKRHVTRDGDRATLAFVGKGNQDWIIEVTDPAVLAVVDTCMRAPGYELFKYEDEAGVRRRASATEVLAYLSEISGHPLHAKDFRTWAASVLAAKAVGALAAELPEAPREKIAVRTVERVAEELRNTAAVCRASYICPAILDEFDPAHVGRAVDRLRRTLSGLRREEAIVLAFLDRRFAESTALAA